MIHNKIETKIGIVTQYIESAMLQKVKQGVLCCSNAVVHEVSINGKNYSQSPFEVITVEYPLTAYDCSGFVYEIEQLINNR